MASSDDVTSPVFDSPSAGAEGAGAAAALTAEALLARKRRRRKIALLVVLAAIIAYIIYRLLGGGSSLPGVSSEVPSYDTSIYGVTQPMGVAVSPDGDRIYVTESGGRRLVRVYNQSGDQVDTLKPAGHKGSWRLPVYVAVSPETEDVYVSDRLREDVEIYDRDGKYLRALKPKGSLGRGANPLGLAFDSDGRLYMTDVSGSRNDHRVLVFGSGDRPQRKIGSAGMFWFPNGLAVDDEGDTYVADSNDGRLGIFTPAGKLVSSIQRGVGDGDLGLPRGVALDGGKLYVVDTTSHTVKVYDLPGKVNEVPSYVGSFGVEGIGDGQFQYPNGIAIDGDGRIYVTDRQNNRVQIWAY
jgi:DNA-binding beta-propeller fold protein YncE